MSFKLSLPFSQAVEDDQIYNADPNADTAIGNGEEQGLRFTADDWKAIIDALYGAEIDDEPSAAERAKQAKILPAGRVWGID